MTSKIALTLLFASLLPVSVHGENIAANVDDVASIEDGEGSARLLLHWNSPITAEHFAIRRATLRFDLSGEAESRILRLRIHPVTAQWGAADVAWSNGWEKPGGDFDEEIISDTDVDLAKGGKTVYVDVSDVLKSRFEEGKPWYGLLVTTVPEDGIGLKEGDLPRFDALASATLDVSYRIVPAKPIELQQDDSVDTE